MSSNDILIVDGSGFIGTWLSDRLLAARHKVRINDKLPSTAHPELSIPGDVRDRDAQGAAATGADTIYNLAAEHCDDVRPVSLYGEVNVGGAENVVSEAESNGINRIVFTSTVAVYPFSPVPLDETAESAPFNDFKYTRLLEESAHDRWRTAAPLAPVFSLLTRLFSRNLRVSRIRFKKFCDITRFDSTRIVKAGFTPEVNTREALKCTVVVEFGSFDNSAK